MTIPSIFAEGEPLRAGFVNVYRPLARGAPGVCIGASFRTRRQADAAASFVQNRLYVVRVTPWTAYSGGPRPVAANERIRVRLHDGNVCLPRQAAAFDWRTRNLPKRLQIAAWQPWPQDR